MQWIAALTLGALVLLSGVAPRPASSGTTASVGDLVDPAIAAVIAADRSDARAEEGIDLSSLLYPYEHFADDGTILRIAYDDRPSPKSIPLAEARDDVRFLFEMFKYGYALYQVFGGDETFLEARDEILAELTSEDPTASAIRVSMLKDLIHQHLAFIQDGHAVFAGSPLYTHYDWFYNARYVFRRDTTGYYTRTHSVRLLGLLPVYWEGRKRYVVSVDGGRPEDGLVLSLSSDGELIYIVSRVASSPSKRLTVDVTLRDGAAISEVPVTLQRDVTEVLPTFDIEPFYTHTPYRLDTRDGIPVVVHRSSVPAPTSAEAALERFVSDAASLRTDDVVILDLRHHTGGQGEYPLHWTETFMGSAFSYDSRWAELTTRTSMRLHKAFAEQYYQGNETMLAAVGPYFDEKIAYLDAHPEAVKDAWALRGEADTTSGLLPNPTTLFVLIDEKTGSAGEEFVYFLRHFQNVIFVGEKTKGLIVSGSPGLGTLPNSGLQFGLPIDVFVGRVGAGLEGIGYSPDIWVEPGQALQRVLRYIESRSHSG